MNKNTNSVLTVQHLTKTFTSKGFFKKPEIFTAVKNLSFTLEKGEILGFLGPNGAGKTTTIQMLLGLLTPTSGTITYFGKDFYHQRAEIMQQVTFASSYLRLPGSLSIEENLSVYGKLYCLPESIRKKQIEKNLEIFGLTDIRNRLTKNLSAGQLTRLMLAKAFLPDPKIVLLDEPTAALDPDIAQQVRDFILHQRKKLGISILFTSHNMAEVEEICDRALILKNGVAIDSATPTQLAATVKMTKLHLAVTTNLDQLVHYLQETQLVYKLEQHTVEIHIDEQNIAKFMSDISKLDIGYNQISIDRPTLEDYFLHIAKSK